MMRATSLRSAVAEVLFVCLLAGCGKAPTAAPVPAPAQVSVPAPPSSVAATSSPAGSATEPATAADAEPARPDLLLAIEGGDEHGVVFRGWPWRLEAVVVAGAPASEMAWSEPGGPALLAVGGAVYVTPEASASTSVDSLELCAGSARSRVRVAAPPASLTPLQVATLHRLQAALALARGDRAAARAAVDAWCVASPHSTAALAARADVLLASGDRDGALAAFSEAIAATPPGALPVASVHRRYGALLREQAAAALAAVPATSAPASDPPATSSVASQAPPATNPAADDRPPGELLPAAEWNDAKVLAATDGQWAARASASSQYSSPQYAAMQATGAPDVKVAGDSANAWCPGAKDTGTAWLELEFATVAAATAVRVRQNLGAGAIVKVEAIAADGSVHTWWQGRDAFQPGATTDFAWFVVRVPATAYAVAKVKLTLDVAAVADWNQIDAVQLVGAR